MGITDMVLFGLLLVNALLPVDASGRMPFTYQNQFQRHCSSTQYNSLCVQNLREFRQGSSLQGLHFVSFLVNKTISASSNIIHPLSSSMGSYEIVSLDDSTNTLPLPLVAGTQHNPTPFLHNDDYQHL